MGLSRCQPERGGKAFWDAEQLDGDSTSRWRTRIASEPFYPRETRVCALRTGEDHVRGEWRSGGRRQADLDALLSHQLHAGASVFSAAPVAPEQRCGTHPQRMQEYTDLARLGRGVALPLTLFAQWARAAVANAGGIDHAQTAIGLSAPLLDPKRLSCGTAQRPIGLERKVGSGEAPRFPRSGAGGWTIPNCGRG